MEELNLFIVKELKELGITAWHGSAPQEFAEYPLCTFDHEYTTDNTITRCKTTFYIFENMQENNDRLNSLSDKILKRFYCGYDITQNGYVIRYFAGKKELIDAIDVHEKSISFYIDFIIC